MSNDRPPLLTRLWRSCLLILGSALCIWWAVHLIEQIWVVLFVVVAMAALAGVVIWWVRTRRNRW
ncbi:hypothetical protein [Agreia sp. VKM Ac-1783]|uniref:hypothetical protein n=1 Tax=Agreia sp. VKM Ac-1783 TaxID=1938889 RepID=UPI000A2AB159|nr:hypothetical protein [Agreia sp. VKM Ac-1783]SMQ71884.1 hypothetical protein SAMN06295943_2771 [Agreia sp. VKM Ac-1783]